MDEQKATRAKILGVLIRDARLHAGRSVEACARVLKMSPAAFERAEAGQEVISLPELEVLAIYLGVPMAHFWGSHTLGEGDEPDYQGILALRRKMIGGLLRQARLEAGLSVEELAQRSGVQPDTLEAYELGQRAIPFLELEELARTLDLSIDYFLEDRHGPLARHETQQKMQRHLDELPADVKEFVAKPANVRYLQTAMRLSKLDADELRGIAAGILEITY
ncbi:MAG TPA: helix-turn-helix transcriptional regulator [Candidatus Sulfomarinibacteraceae bacterium]|nr:helix-turn-helix transcriptional regulator [Candidatus Sulfomarinibacteraceae bacterium]